MMAVPVAFSTLVLIVIFAILAIIASHMIRSSMEEKAVKEYHDNIEHMENHKSNAGDPIIMAGRT